MPTMPKADIALQKSVLLETQVQKMKDQIETLENKVDNVDVITLNDTVKRLKILIDGSVEHGVPGLRQDVRELKQVIYRVEEDRRKIKWIMIGVGLTGISNLSTFIAMLAKIYQVLGGK